MSSAAPSKPAAEKNENVVLIDKTKHEKGKSDYNITYWRAHVTSSSSSTSRPVEFQMTSGRIDTYTPVFRKHAPSTIILHHKIRMSGGYTLLRGGRELPEPHIAQQLNIINIIQSSSGENSREQQQQLNKKKKKKKPHRAASAAAAAGATRVDPSASHNNTTAPAAICKDTESSSREVNTKVNITRKRAGEF
ncbi:hypothetical protein DAPPUDRAFT_243798 [Daphnia pulex]|uniref:Uncharacterized protein n=1 Tax=Daphnia pulex TaxID=6669 RepID=E9GK56_DAPPU|nr:hypothetical protein DAPPUDRAFT_243798 [Daphnia pulex]|eukprot:EFX80303.1 hypothetical protein DAPPUDRAFT_243798 [Daphnia pulex]